MAASVFRSIGKKSVLGSGIAVLLALTGASAMARDLASDTVPTKVAVDLGTAYIPQGFDSNDNVQLVVEGIFENTCFRQAPTRAVVDPVTRELKLYPQAYYYDGFCLQMVVPYNQTLDIGLVPAGQYQVMDMTGGSPRFASGPSTRGRSLGMMTVDQATRAEADDYLYAPVDQAFVDTQGTDGKQVLHLTGNFTLSCAGIKEVKVSMQDKVMVVLPITEIRQGQCQSGSYPFHQTLELPAGVKSRTLIHVRSLNGKALNVLNDLN